MILADGRSVVVDYRCPRAVKGVVLVGDTLWSIDWPVLNMSAPNSTA